MDEIKVQGQILDPISYQLKSILFHVNQPSDSWDTAIVQFEPENPGQGHEWD